MLCEVGEIVKCKRIRSARVRGIMLIEPIFLTTYYN